MKDIYLSIDCGLTSTKAVLFDEDGNSLGTERFVTPLTGFELDTRKLGNGVASIIEKLLHKTGIEGKRVKSVSVNGHGNGCYFLGKNGKILRGISSMITDPTPLKSERAWEITGQSCWSGQPLAIMSWLARTDREFLDQVQCALSCKDSIRYMMTGVAATDYSDVSAAGMLDWQTGSYSSELLSLYGLAEYEDILPPVLKCTDVVGTVTGEFARVSGLAEGTAVLGGLFDVSGCILGSGLTVPGSFGVIAGTWGIHVALSEKLTPHRSITHSSYFLTPDQAMCVDSAPTSFANITWFEKKEGSVAIEDRNRMVETTKGDPGLIFLPYCYQPMDLGPVKAEYIGLKPEHTYEDRLRAVYEGIVFEHVRRLSKFKALGIQEEKITLSGGGAGSSVFAQMLSDVSGLPVETKFEKEAGALGGAILSAAVSGSYGSIQEAAGRMVKKDKYYEPHFSSYYQEKYEAFLRAINVRQKGEK